MSEVRQRIGSSGSAENIERDALRRDLIIASLTVLAVGVVLVLLVVASQF